MEPSSLRASLELGSSIQLRKNEGADTMWIKR